jgi:hypothetical protein
VTVVDFAILSYLLQVEVTVADFVILPFLPQVEVTVAILPVGLFVPIDLLIICLSNLLIVVRI